MCVCVCSVELGACLMYACSCLTCLRSLGIFCVVCLVLFGVVVCVVCFVVCLLLCVSCLLRLLDVVGLGVRYRFDTALWRRGSVLGS